MHLKCSTGALTCEISLNLAVHPVKSPYKSYLHSKLVRPDVNMGESLQEFVNFELLPMC